MSERPLIAGGSCHVPPFQRRLAGMGIAEVVSAPSSPWQNPYVERLIGSRFPELTVLNLVRSIHGGSPRTAPSTNAIDTDQLSVVNT
jgi:hypothetical protein